MQERRARLETLQAGLRDDRANLEDSRSDRAGVLAALNREMRSQAEEIDRLKKDEEYLLRLIRGLNLYLDELHEDRKVEFAFDHHRGQLELPARARLISRFGDPKQGELTWEGLFLGASEGQQVHAVFRGRVAFADWFGSLGLLLIIDHGDGYMSLYGHNQALYADVGDWVETGQLVSSAGNSGGLDHPGLYFEIRHNGVPRNPLLWVRPS
jgi:septal ring factor EnvC (AmiA/AmiB activator)